MMTFPLAYSLKRAIEVVRYDGPHYLFLRLLPLCFSPFGSLGFLDFFQKDLTKPLGEVRTGVELTVGPATESEIDPLTHLVERRYANSRSLEWYSKLGIRETIRQRFQRGCKCFVGRVENEIVHYNWIFFHSEETEPGLGRFLLMKDDEALCNDGFTSEAWRGRSVHTKVNNEMLRFLQKSGYRKAYTIAGTQTKSSQKALYRLGWEYRGTVLFFIPRGAQEGQILRLRGCVDPFVEKPVSRSRIEERI